MSPLQLSLLALASITVSACCGGRPLVVHAELSGAGDPAHGVVVSGMGEAKAAPDLAHSSVGVEVRAATVEEASSQASARMSAVINALKQGGVADKDLRTQSFSINFEQEPVPPPMPPPMPMPEAPVSRSKDKAAMSAAVAVAAPAPVQTPRGFYRASNMVEVTIRDLSKLGTLLQLATNAGANIVWGISFELEHPETLMAQARARAVEHAKANAAELARLTGVTLGRLVSVTENGSSGGTMPMMMKEMRAADASQSVPVEQGEISVSQQVQLVYALPGE